MTAKQIMSKVKAQLAEQSLTVARKRYMRIDERGNPIETPEEMFFRVADYLAKAELRFNVKADVEALTDQFYQMLARIEFVPGGRVFFEAGNEHTGQMASCFVLPVEDSVEEIFQTLKDGAITQQKNGGTGFNFSKIRPRGDTVNGVPNVAAGPVHYLRSFDQAFSQILQGSKRHGGNMGVLNIDHPDIEEFIKLKDQGAGIKNFNISVGVTDKFMEALRNDASWDLVNPRNGEVKKTVRARELFEMITQRAWECADPGMIFLDAVARGNNNAHLYDMVATNPCGEQPLGPYESCNLGSVVLSNHVTPAGEVDWQKLSRTAVLATRFMDNMIELNKYPIPAIDYMVRQTRKIGIGVMGFAQMLYKVGLPYNSDEAVRLMERIMKHLHESIQEASMALAEERGVYPAWQGSRWEEKGIKIRNSHLTSIAPTGTISMLANTSSGVEPYFGLVTVRKSFFEQSGDDSAAKATVLRIVAEDFEKIAREQGFFSEALMDRIAEEGSVQNMKEVPDEVKRVFVTTHDVSYEWHVKIQAAAQKYTDAAVSKTVNMPHSATVHDVRSAYIMAYQLGCKGITIYRDGSKSGQVLNLKEKSEKTEHAPEAVIYVSAPAPVVPAANAPVSSPTAASINSEAHITPNALTVLEKRALQKDASGQAVETPDQLFRRVAKFVASPERNYDVPAARVAQIEEKFFQMMSRLEFISGQALRNADSKLTMSACLVLPIEDNIEGIMQTIAENVFAHKSTCGTGINYSRLRMKGGQVGSVGGVAAGPVHFMKAVSVAQKTVQTKGGRSQGSMGILNVDHPDIEAFIRAKDAEGEFDNMNISVGATDAFMEAIRNDTTYDMVDPGSLATVRQPQARAIFRQIAEHAWTSGDPGVIFVDRLERDNPTPSLGKLDATNPCGEQPLLPYETCNLGSIIVSRFVTASADGTVGIDWDRLKETVYYSVRFLDNTIDVNNFPLAKVEQMSKGTRRIGLGVMGFADMLVKLGVSYNSDAAVQLAEQVMKFVNDEAHKASAQLGEEKGSFPYFDISVWPQKGLKARRNSAVTTIAPTGYTSIVANCSSGIEPIYALAFRRENSMGGTDQFESNFLFAEVAKAGGFYTPEVMQAVADHGTIKDIAGIPDDVKRVFVTAFDITPEWHIRIQAAFQKYTDNAVSKTINFPNHSSVEDIAHVYQLAYDLGCKGVTVFRDGCREEQALLVGKKGSANDKRADAPVAVAEVKAPLPQGRAKRARPTIIAGKTYRKKTGYGDMYITINNDEEGNPFEVFAQIGKTGGFYAAKSEAICRLVSMSLRSGINVEEIVGQLKGIRGPMPIWDNGVQVFSMADAIAQTLEQHVKEPQAKLDLKFSSVPAEKPKHVAEAHQEAPEVIEAPIAKTESIIIPTAVAAPSPAVQVVAQQSGQKEYKPMSQMTQTSVADLGVSPDCPECGSGLEYGEGCLLCRGCGYSKCG
ncbi:MAG: vitamin B12-dependent ribonucleotide reductase [Parcubacteria group bacterium]|nr:vitamin B12-dependent ribonucleotide reductase [Parcubacteria group bacterium]